MGNPFPGLPVSRLCLERFMASVPLAFKWALAKLRPRIEPLLKRQNLEWADILMTLETIDTWAENEENWKKWEAFMDGPLLEKWCESLE